MTPDDHMAYDSHLHEADRLLAERDRLAEQVATLTADLEAHDLTLVQVADAITAERDVALAEVNRLRAQVEAHEAAANYTKRVLHAFETADSYSEVFWRVHPDGTTRFYALVNDTFHYATADAEEILPDDVDLLERCLADVVAVDETWVLGVLFAARKRGRLPIGGLPPGLHLDGQGHHGDRA